MIYALDKIAPGTANDDTLLYGVEVKFYNMEVEIDENLESPLKGLYIIGDGSGVTHSLSHGFRQRDLCSAADCGGDIAFLTGTASKMYALTLTVHDAANP